MLQSHPYRRETLHTHHKQKPARSRTPAHEFGTQKRFLPAFPGPQKPSARVWQPDAHRSIKALPKLYQSEGQPPTQTPIPAEQRMITAAGLTEFVAV